MIGGEVRQRRWRRRRTVGNVYHVYSEVLIELFACVLFGPKMFTVRVRLSLKMGMGSSGAACMI